MITHKDDNLDQEFSMDDKNSKLPNRILINILLFIALMVIITLNAISYLQITSFKDSYIVIIADVVTLVFFISYILLFNWQFNLLYRNISRRIEHENAIKGLNEVLSYEMQELGIHTEKMNLLIELSDMLQTCTTMEEAAQAITVKCRRILHFAVGSLYISTSLPNEFEFMTSWGDQIKHKNMIKLEECWALRKSVSYYVKNLKTDVLCEHIIDKTVASYMCIPLMAQNTVFGLLHLDLLAENLLNSENRILISVVTETLALGLGNIKLRETLRNQSLLDSLTGLYNRRYLNEFLLHEINYAKRNKTTFAILMIDIDYFKQFNDQYGHEAGDLVLQELSAFFQKEVRASDITARYGGEEFLCVLHDCSLEGAIKRAEILRTGIAKLNIFYKKHSLGPITISVGVAVFPMDGLSTLDLIESADKALYQAKATGRNKIIIYSEMKH